MDDERIEILQGTITSIHADAIVNAANTTLSGGGGVDGAIHEAAGLELDSACENIGSVRTGEAVITPGFHLPARFIIHTAGPVWIDGKHQEDELLSSCYRNCLELAVRRNIRTLAFPAISTGRYGFPKERACQIALNEVRIFLSVHPEIEKVLFICHSKEDYSLYQSLNIFH